jgi:rSAM/selenodomain-associated transferase 1
MSNQADAVVIVVCKAPERGRVKTRLAADIGDDNALRVYSLMMATLFANLELSRSYDVCACVHGNIQLVQAGTIDQITQYGETLGDRICNAVRDCDAYKKKIVIGSDTPKITSAMVHDAMHALDTADIVIGPAVDGGYYLIGMKQLHTQLFEGMPWSTDQIFTQTCAKMDAASLRYVVLPKLRDIDTIDDLKAVMPELLPS